MKYILLIFITGILCITQLSCYDDKGSYDYHEINEITISNWPSNGYTYLYLDTLKITPQIGTYDSTRTNDPYLVFSMDDGDPSRYEYYWEVEETNISSSETAYKATISTERNLVFPLTLETGSYRLYFKIKDSKTDILWFSESSLTVQSSTDEGFLILGEKEDGNVGMDMISFAAGDTIILKGILDNCGLPSLQGPHRVMYTGNYARNCYVWLSTESGSYYFDPTTMQSSPDNTFDVFNVSAITLPDPLVITDISAKRYFGTSAATMNRIILTEDYAFACQLGAGEFYGNPFNCYSATSQEYFKPFPYVFVGNYYSQNRYIIYDKDNHRFVYISSGLASNVTQFGTDASTDPFPWQQPEGRDLIYGENSNMYSGLNTYSFALLEDNDNFYLYQFLMGSTSSKTACYTFAKSDVPNMHKDQLFAIASSRPLLLYADGSTLRAYDYANKRNYQMEMDGEITCMEFDYTGNLDEIMIATYNDEEQGIIERYQLGSDLLNLDLTPLKNCRWTGLVKVKDIEYKN